MSNFDVRRTRSEQITNIIVASPDSSAFAKVLSLSKAPHLDAKRVLISVQGRQERTVVCSEQHARDIIKGLEKAISEGWFD